MAELMCCGRPVSKSKSKTTGVYTISCGVCGKVGAGSTPGEAEARFLEATGRAVVPSDASGLPVYMAQRLKQDLAQIAAPFVANDRPALTRLVKNSVRYVMTAKHLEKVWTTEEGRESLVHGMEEALALGAELGKMGDIVPFGTVAEFIPSIEAYEFALTNGKNPPFAWVQIDIIHKNDVAKISRTNGSFSCEIQPTFPRGEVVAVAVYGQSNRLDRVIGEVYDKERLLEKALAHSSSYKRYIQQMRAVELAKSEGRYGMTSEGREYADILVLNTDDKYADRDKEFFAQAEAAKELKKDNKGDYAVQTLPKRGGGTWTKKIYRSQVEGKGVINRVYLDELSNPYDGPDQPEMLRKAAGKSFLGKYAKVRNSEAAMDEEASNTDGPDAVVEKSVDSALERAFSAFDEAEVVDVEPEPATEPEPTPDAEAEEALDPETEEALGDLF